MRYRFRVVCLLVCLGVIYCIFLILTSCSIKAQNEYNCNCGGESANEVATSPVETPSDVSTENEDIRVVAFDLFEDFANMLHLTKSKTDNLLFTKDVKDKNGIALRLLDSLSEFATVSEARVSNFRNNFETFTRFALEDASILMKKKLKRLQRPKNCRNVSKVNCNIVKNCGIGCQIHHLIYCLAVR